MTWSRRGRQPYRGQVRPKVWGRRSPPKPIYRVIEFLFWFVFAVVGIGIFSFAINRFFFEKDFGGFAVFVLYLVFLFIAIFAFRDAKQIETITPDENVSEDEEDFRSSQKEEFIEVEPGPLGFRWRYLISDKKSDRKRNLFPFLGFLAIGIVIAIGAIFGFSSPITLGLVIVGFLIFLGMYLTKN